jgi:hypothetical protein
MKYICFFTLLLSIVQIAQAQQPQQLENLKQKALNQSNNADAWIALAVATDLYAEQLQGNGSISEATLYAYEAQDYFQLALGIAPFDAQKWKQVGMHYLQKKGSAQNRGSAAISYLQRAEALNPNDAQVLISLKEAYASIGLQVKSEQFNLRIKNAQNGTNQSPYHKF